MFSRKTKSAGGVVLNKDGKVLVVNQNGNSWSLPKGHIDDGEVAIDTAKREVFEESGLDDLILIKPLMKYERFRIGKDPTQENKSEIKEIEMFLFKTDFKGELVPQDPANPEAKWVDKNKVGELLTHPKDKEFFEKVMFELN